MHLLRDPDTSSNPPADTNKGRSTRKSAMYRKSFETPQDARDDAEASVVVWSSEYSCAGDACLRVDLLHGANVTNSPCCLLVVTHPVIQHRVWRCRQGSKEAHSLVIRQSSRRLVLGGDIAIYQVARLPVSTLLRPYLAQSKLTLAGLLHVVARPNASRYG